MSLEDTNAFDGGIGMVSALSSLASQLTCCCKVESLVSLSEYPLALIASGTFNFKSSETLAKSLAALFSRRSFFGGIFRFHCHGYAARLIGIKSSKK